MPILPAQLNYCVERPREISGIDIESVAVGTRAAHRNGKRADEGEDGEHGWPTKKRERQRSSEGERGGQAPRGREIFNENGSPGHKRSISWNNFQ